MASIDDVARAWESGQGWDLSEQAVVKRGDAFPVEVVPYISSPKEWARFNDDLQYSIEKDLRAFIEAKSKDPQWRGHHSQRKYRPSVLFSILYARPFDVKQDMPAMMRLVKLMAYYSSRINKHGYDSDTGKKHNGKPSYVLSCSRLKKPPMNLKLRLEWYAEQGIMPTFRNMRVIDDDLKPGHARNPRTEEHMKAMEQKGRDAFNEYQRRRRESLKQMGEECEPGEPGRLLDEAAPDQDDGRDSQDSADID